MSAACLLRWNFLASDHGGHGRARRHLFQCRSLQGQLQESCRACQSSGLAGRLACDMDMSKRYQVSGPEGEFEPDSNGQVLRNLVGIASPDDMDELELRLLGELYDEVLVQSLPERPLTVADLKRWHQLWLGNVYAWAGRERSVNLGKGGFQFATASLLPGLLRDFERQYLARWTPCSRLGADELVHAVAVTHVELIVIHPFREGNGRLSRLLADVMAVQAGHEPLDYSSWEQRKSAYIGAIHAGFSGDYCPMVGFVTEAMAAGEAGKNTDEIN